MGAFRFLLSAFRLLSSALRIPHSAFVTPHRSSQVGVRMVREHSEPAVEADQIWSGLAYGIIGAWWFAASLRLRLSYRR